MQEYTNLGTLILTTLSILCIVCGVFWRFIIAPLADSIKRLGDLIAAMRDDFQKEHERREEMNQRLARVEERSKSNTHRINKMEDHIRSATT